MNTERLNQQIHFILEIDRLKDILRQSYLIHSRRRENSAEHSWHLALLAIVLAEHADTSFDLLRLLKMLLIHDVVEIDAGDTYIYGEYDEIAKIQQEQQAAERIFGLLPPDQSAEMKSLWAEFEAKKTPEARFAGALDRLMPLLHNYHTQGVSWKEHGVRSEQVFARNQSPLAKGSAGLWEYARQLIEDAIAQGYLAK